SCPSKGGIMSKVQPATKTDLEKATATAVSYTRMAITQINDKAAHADARALKMAHAQNNALMQLGKIKGIAKDLESHAHADLIGAALSGFGEGGYRMTRAFLNERPWEGGAEIMRMVASVTKMGFLL